MILASVALDADYIPKEFFALLPLERSTPRDGPTCKNSIQSSGCYVTEF